jgi:hypothetical protein
MLLGLLALQAVVLVGMTLSPDERLSVQTRPLFPELEPEKVSRLEIRGPAGDAEEVVVLERTGNDWTLPEADGYPAKSDDVKSFLDKVTALVSRTAVLSSARYHEKLEVSEAKYQRKLTLTADGESTVLYLGTSPSFKNTHVRIEGSDDVWLVNDFGTTDAGTRAWNWTERSYVDTPKNDVWAVEVTNEKGSFKLERDPVSNQWAALGVDGALDSSKVDQLVDRVRSIRLERPVGKNLEPSYGLAPPAGTVRLTVGTSTVAGAPPPSTEVQTVQLGARVEGKNERYVKASTSDYVVVVNDSSVETVLEREASDLVP